MPPVLACRQDSIYDLVRSRWGWLLLFFGGLVLAAIVVEAFEEVLKQHVQLSYFGERLGQCGGASAAGAGAVRSRSWCACAACASVDAGLQVPCRPEAQRCVLLPHALPRCLPTP